MKYQIAIIGGGPAGYTACLLYTSLTGIFIMLIRIKCLIPVRGGYVPIIMVVPVKEGIVAG